MYDSPYMTEYETDLHWTPDITPYGTALVWCGFCGSYHEHGDGCGVIDAGEMSGQIDEWLRC